MKVVTVSINDSNAVVYEEKRWNEAIDVAKSLLDDAEVDDKILIHLTEMSEEDFKNLEEFEGF